MRLRKLLATAVLALVPGVLAAANADGAVRSTVSLSASDWSDESIGSLDAGVFDTALNAASCAVRTGAVEAPRTLTVIDYSKPSSEKRMWVFDLASHELLYEELVAHGQGSGANLATEFSNDADSHQSSLGLFRTEDVYVGKNGYSLRLDGLDRGVNDHARDRAIVLHGAPYVSDAFVKANGRLGRSWGCPAIRAEMAHQIIDRVKNGGLVFAYHPRLTQLRTTAQCANQG